MADTFVFVGGVEGGHCDSLATRMQLHPPFRISREENVIISWVEHSVQREEGGGSSV